jgi:chromosome segregation ATPase
MKDHPYPRERTWSDCEAELERLRDEEVRLTSEVGKLRLLLRDARDEVAEIAGQQTKRHRIEEYREQLAAIDEALGDVPEPG